MSLPASKISPVGNYRQQPNKALISTKPFNSEFFSYSTYVDSSFNTRGTLAVNAAATAALCPAGRILHANGKFLSTGVNPDLTAGGTTYSYLMGVLDSVTGLNGYINPASATFANYDVNLPVQYDGGNLSIVPPLGGQGAKLQVGPQNSFAVFSATTAGTTTLTVTAMTAGTIQVGMTVNAATNLTSGQKIASFGTGTGGAGTYILDAVADTTQAVAFEVHASQNGTVGSPLNASAGRVALDGATPTTVFTTACKATSLVFLTQVGGTAAATTVAAADGSFVVAGPSDAAYNFLIVN